MPGVVKFVLLGIPVLGVIVLAHELGHFVAARLVGVRVLIFSIGFGRRLVGFRRGETDYRVSLIPVGGYVKMAGDSVEEEREGAPYEYLSRKWWERVIIAVAGPGANLAMALVCGVLMFAFGVQYPHQPNVVGPVDPGSVADSLGLRQEDVIVSVAGDSTRNWRSVVMALDAGADAPGGATLVVTTAEVPREIHVPRSAVEALLTTLVPNVPAVVGALSVGLPAYQAGLRKGDRIVEIDGVPIRAWSDLRRNIIGRAGEPITLLVEREGATFTRSVTPLDQDGSGVIGIEGISYGIFVQRFSPGESVRLGVSYAFTMAGNFLRGFAQLFVRPAELGKNVVGPIGIMQMSAEQVERGRTDLLNWLIFVSIALLIMNLLPIPVLDGGHVLSAVIEAVRGRQLGARGQGILWRAGAAFLLALMVYVTAKDIFREWQRSRADRQVAPVESVTDVSTNSTAGE